MLLELPINFITGYCVNIGTKILALASNSVKAGLDIYARSIRTIG
jgi:hypothetical protein